MLQTKKEYDAAWTSSQPYILKNNIFVDPFLSDEHSDKRFGLTVLIKLDGDVVKRIIQVISQLKQIEPHQYFYPVSDLHVTVLTLVEAVEGFVFDEKQIDRYKNVFQTLFKEIYPFSILFNGLCATRSAIFIQGFAGEHLKNLREIIRQALSQVGLPWSQRVAGNFIHSCVVRFKEQLGNPEKLVDFIEKSRELFIGEFQVQSISFVCNDWYSRHTRTKSLVRYCL